MCRVTIRFYEELNDYLPAHLRRKDIHREFPGRRSVKALIESFGVPPAAVDLVLVKGRSVDFTCIVQHGDRISVYPVFESLSIKDITRLRPEPLRTPRFASDVHLGKLVRLLRLAGFDVWYNKDCKGHELATLSERHGRILLTRNPALLIKKNIMRGILITDADPDMQVKYVLSRLDLKDACRPFTRCTQCNALLEDTIAEDVLQAHRVRTLRGRRSARGTPVTVCPACGRTCWQHSRPGKLQKRAGRLLREGC